MKVSTNGIKAANSVTGERDPLGILESMLGFLSEGKIAEVVGGFDQHFSFTDHALDLEFKDKGQSILNPLPAVDKSTRMAEVQTQPTGRTTQKAVLWC